MTLRRLVVIAALIGTLAIYVVCERSRITRAGYEISRLSRNQVQLAEDIRIRRVYVARLRQPECIRQQVVQLRIGLARPEQERMGTGFALITDGPSEFAQ